MHVDQWIAVSCAYETVCDLSYSFMFLSRVSESIIFYLRFFFFQAEDGIRDLVRSRGLGDVYKRQGKDSVLREFRLVPSILIHTYPPYIPIWGYHPYRPRR